MDEKMNARKQELLEKVYALVDKKMPADKAKMIRAFVQHHYRNCLAEDILLHEADDLFGAAVSIWTFGQSRENTNPAIRVYNPRFEQHGWHSNHTVIEIVNDDMPFLVDSISMELARQRLNIHQIIHPVFVTKRDRSGKLTQQPVAPQEGSIHGDCLRESYIQIEVDEQSSRDMLENIKTQLENILRDVRFAVQDWPAMRDQCLSLIKEMETTPPAGQAADTVNEGQHFLQWLYDDHFTFLGYHAVDYDGKGKNARLVRKEESGLGLLRKDSTQVIFEGLDDLGKQSQNVRDAVFDPTLIRIVKASRRSTIHRRVHMDTVALKRYDKKGNAIGEHLFIGLMTSAAYSQSSYDIPILRHKIQAVADLAGFTPEGHNGKALRHVLENYPREELFQMPVPLILETARGILNLQERQRLAVFLRPDIFQRYMSVMAYVPRERFSTELRQNIGKILAQEFNGELVAHSTRMSDESLTQVHFVVKTIQTEGGLADYDRREIEVRVIEGTRSWEDHLRQALIEEQGEERGIALFRRYESGFPVAYKDSFNAQTAIYDIGRIEEALKTNSLQVNLFHPIEVENHQLRFKIYNPGGPVVLSRVIPMMENMGVNVVEESPYDIHVAGETRSVFIHDFHLETQDGQAVDFQAVREVFHESFVHIWSGQVENDGFNRLVLAAGLGWRDVVVLRAYSKYLRQASIPFSQDYMEETLANNARIARHITDLFTMRFDPAQADSKGKRAKEHMVIANIDAALEEVTNLDEDRIIRRFLNMVQVTLRTNFFQDDENGQPKGYISFKFSSRDIDELPQPAPLREIFVYSPRFEAVHLRFGMVARGGLRWSDRREDFRTEILGLVKAQQVKNAVIVPVGSKGGFVLKKAPCERQAFFDEGVACYRLFISGMLDITDNLVKGEVTPPCNVVCHDDEDPYLVVAADKGTATFSDFANEVSRQYGFWLDDAFASGGSAGYDHKKMGITARGGWEAVKRHFREMGHNTQTQDFTVIGVGDMAGDVFGNGMLLSQHIRLIAAFNHLHIFVDPEPNAARSFKERQRLFENVKGWGDYNQTLLSKGGGVFERSAKSIPISAQMKKLFSITQDTLPPNMLISAILKSEADLLWFGGIGTYVKHSLESDTDAGDRANDSLRVNANELRCKVIGEGANLGVTHLARIQFAQNGGRVNTDAIDNSAGVDCSDHEVNIKILLGDVVQHGDMTEKQRNQLLEEMTDDVSQLVLRDNYQQTQSISVIESLASNTLDRQQRLIRSLERAGDLDRALEFLPDDEEIAERRQKKQGLTRPEIAVVFAYAKNITYRDLLNSDLPDDPILEDDLIRYFPGQIQQRFKDNILSHQLRREIIATVVTNSMINRTGAAFLNEMYMRTGMASSAIARAFTIVREVFGLRDVWKSIEALDNKTSADTQISMLRETGRTIERMTEWFLRNGEHPLDIADNIKLYHSGVKTLRDNLAKILSPFAAKDLEKRCRRFSHEGVPEKLATAIAQLKVLSSACDVIGLATVQKHSVEKVGWIYSATGERFALDWLRSAANRIPSDNQWHRLALSAIIDDLWNLQSEIASRVLGRCGATEGALDEWVTFRSDTVERIDGLVGELRTLPQLDLAMLAVMNRELRNLLIR